MARLLIIADDFTGALDTGVQFTTRGIETRVIIDDSSGGEISEIEKHHQSEVLVLDAETRHSKPTDAYQKVFSIVKKAKEVGITYIYKKTDSALRGNIGSELTAVLDASGEKVLPFIPAFPKMNRITMNGIHYIDGLPVSESVFGQDPFEPVTRNSVKEIIELQSNKKVIEIQKGDEKTWKEGILVFDAKEEEDLERIADRIEKEKTCHIMAGCAGFAGKLPQILTFQQKAKQAEELEQKLLFVCGSVNPITKKQLEYGESCGYCRIHLLPEEKLSQGYWDTKEGKNSIQRLKKACEESICCMIDSNDKGKTNETLEYAKLHGYSLEQVRSNISESVGEVLKRLLDEGVKALLLVTGGDTLLGFMKKIGSRELIPVGEIASGCVLTKLEYKNESYHIITKSGGFGEERLLENFVTKLIKK